MAPKLKAHIRFLKTWGPASLADMIAVCRKLQAKYPNIIYFAPPTYNAVWPRPDAPGKFGHGDRESGNLMAWFRDPETCVDLLKKEQLQYERAPGVHMLLRAPWPEEDDQALKLARPYSGTTYTVYDEPGFWRRKGRLIDVILPPAIIQTRAACESQETQWLRKLKKDSFSKSDFGEAQVLTRLMSGGLEARYNASDPECAAFMRDARSVFGKQKTTRIGYYAPATGQYLGPNQGPYKASCGRELLRWLCHNPTVFLNFNALYPFTKDLPRPLAAEGPAPDFKAEVFLEAGLPIDDIEGLTEGDRDRLKRRFEKKQESTAPSAKT